MKKTLTLLLLLVVTMQLFAQTGLITVNNISLPSIMDANTKNWGSGTSIFTITASTRLINGKVDSRVIDGKIFVAIKKNGAKICGTYTSSSAPAAGFNGATKVWSGSTAVSLLGQDCVLPPGDYEICVQFFGYSLAAPAPLSEEKCKSFSIPAKEQQTYQPPQLIAPANGTVLSESDVKKPITFRWTRVVPTPQEPVTYRLKVWQLMKGQNGVQAMKANQPIITKDVDNLTQATVNNLINGPCLPPYLCDFVWNVQAINKEGKPIGGNDGMSGTNAFSIMGSYSITVQNLAVACPKGTNYNFTVNVGNPNNSVAIFDKLEIAVVNGVVITPINITPASPAIGSFIPANGNINVSASFNYASVVNTVCIKAYIKEQANPLLNTASSFTCDTLKCVCDYCKTLGVIVQKDKLTVTASTSNQILLSGILDGLDPAVVKKVTIELVYYSIEQTEDGNCAKCADNREWGNFSKPARSYFSGYETGTLNGLNFGREWSWLTKEQKECSEKGKSGGNSYPDLNAVEANCATCGITTVNDSKNPNAKITKAGDPIIVAPNTIPSSRLNSFSLPIAVPTGSSLKCCGDKIKVCIRYTIWDFCCHACDIVKCYEIERKAK